MFGSDRCSRRQFFQWAGATGFMAGMALKPLSLLANALGHGATSAGATPLADVGHVVIDRDAARYAGRPRQGGIADFGDGELAVMYWRGPCAYRTAADVSDSLDQGWLSGAEVVLRRSLDGGESWPAAHDVIVHSNALPVEQRAEFLCRDPAQRAVLDMAAPGAMFFFGRSPLRVNRTTRRDRWRGWHTERSAELPPQGGCTTLCQVRSVDRGRSWESAPLLPDLPSGVKIFRADNHPPVTMPNGALIAVVECDGALWLYGTESQGMTWQQLSLIAPAGEGGASCGGLVMLPGGRVQCYYLQGGRVCLTGSDDCFSWTPPRAITAEDRAYHAPWPLRLRDGRIVLVAARIQAPFGIAAMVSEDDGLSWSDEALVRDDAAGPDIGWPVAMELADGRIFAAYQYQSDGVTRYIAGSFFRLR